MKLNLGIRRRLAPLLDNGRGEIELATAILFSLPGSPILYYGDEIGMGDNVYLGDRDGVRTPMQWTVDRNGGFSRADFAQLYLPPLMDPVYGYQAVNVEAQLRTPTSLLRWIHRFIELRKEHPVFGCGAVRGAAAGELHAFSACSAPSTTTSCSACTTSRGRRRRSNSTSRGSQGYVPEEMFGRTRFPRIGELPYLLTFAGRGFFWFNLRKDDGAVTDVAERLGLDGQFDSADLIAYIRNQRWFGARSMDITGIALVDAVPLPGDDRAWLALLELRFETGTHEMYQLVLGTGEKGAVEDEIAALDDCVLYEASRTPRIGRLIVDAAPDGHDTRRSRRKRRVPRHRTEARRRRGRRGAPARRRPVEHVARRGRTRSW